MKLPKDIREKLYTGQETPFAWPEDARVEPEEGKVLRLETGTDDDLYFRIISVSDDGKDVLAKIVTDLARYLPRVGGDYVDNLSRAAWFSGEPELEPIDKHSQERQSEDSRNGKRERLEEAVAGLDEARRFFDETVRNCPELQREVGREVWRIRRAADQARQRLRQRMAA